MVKLTKIRITADPRASHLLGLNPKFGHILGCESLSVHLPRNSSFPHAPQFPPLSKILMDSLFGRNHKSIYVLQGLFKIMNLFLVWFVRNRRFIQVYQKS